jgi:hypothetical protein
MTLHPLMISADTRTLEGLRIPSDNDSGIQKETWEYVPPRIVQCILTLQSLDLLSLKFY